MLALLRKNRRNFYFLGEPTNPSHMTEWFFSLGLHLLMMPMMLKRHLTIFTNPIREEISS